MNAAVVIVFSLAFLALAYRFYGRFIASRLGVDPSCPTPAHTRKDGVDFVPTKLPVLFGHHFASIAAAGPIVGPTLAVIFGFLPAWLWIVFGVVFMGAVHDFTALFVSLRERGRSISEISRSTLGGLGFFFFSVFAFALLVLVAAAFTDIAAVALTSAYPAADLGVDPARTVLHTWTDRGVAKVIIGGIASTSAIVLTLFAPLLGFLIYRRKSNPWAMIALGALVCFISIAVGFYAPLTISPRAWIIVILVYSVTASFLPVWLVLQPRDFVNVQLLYLGLVSLVSGVILAGLKGATLTMPATNITADTAKALGSVWPFLFITIACGAVSGAHSLVATGTTSKQVDKETDAPIIGYCGMLLEGVLGLSVLLVIATGLSYDQYMSIAWQGKNAPLAFAVAVGNTLQMGFGLPVVLGTLFGIILLEGFLLTTIDTVLRIARYLLEEWWELLFRGKERVPVVLRWRLTNALIPVLLTAALAVTAGYKAIWSIFGSANQLLAALTLIVATVWLMNKARAYWFAAVPAVFMAATTLTALAQITIRGFAPGGNRFVGAIAAALFLLGLGFVALSVKTWAALRRCVAAIPFPTNPAP
jgi:carbon starvation protein